MPRRRWRSRTRTARLVDPLRAFLESGDPGHGQLTLFILSRPGGDPALLRPLWERHRDEILPAWVGQHPGRRPWAWWVCDAPGPRHVLDHGPVSTCVVRRRAWGAEPIQPDIKVTIEAQAAFLLRAGLLFRGEAERLTARDYAPILLAPGECEMVDEEDDMPSERGGGRWRS